MAYRQTPRGFPDRSLASLYRNINMDLTFFTLATAGRREVRAELNFITARQMERMSDSRDSTVSAVDVVPYCWN